MTGLIRSCIYDCLLINPNNQSIKIKEVGKRIQESGRLEVQVLFSLLKQKLQISLKLLF